MILGLSIMSLPLLQVSSEYKSGLYDLPPRSTSIGSLTWHLALSKVREGVMISWEEERSQKWVLTSGCSWSRWGNREVNTEIYGL